VVILLEGEKKKEPFRTFNRNSLVFPGVINKQHDLSLKAHALELKCKVLTQSKLRSETKKSESVTRMMGIKVPGDVEVRWDKGLYACLECRPVLVQEVPLCLSRLIFTIKSFSCTKR